jgi:hypothetical protein
MAQEIIVHKIGAQDRSTRNNITQEIVELKGPKTPGVSDLF